MKTKFIVASSIWLLGIISMVLWATTFAWSTGTNKMGGYGSWAKMMGNRDGMKHQFTSTWDDAAFRTAVGTAIKAKDYTGFVRAHTTYGITINMTQTQFEEMAANSLELEELHTNINKAIAAGDYTAWQKLNANSPLVSKIDTEAKFKQYQEMYSYQEKARALGVALWIQGPQWDGMGIGQRKWMKGMGQVQGRWLHMRDQTTTAN